MILRPIVLALIFGHAPLALSQEAREADSLWERRLTADAVREAFSITNYRPSYVLLTRAASLNQPGRAADAPPLDHTEIKFQLSLQTKIANDLLGSDGDLWVAYTQVAYWQTFNNAASAPFRETNHRPEAYVSFLTDQKLLGWRVRTVNFGLVHESNGQSVPASRSWNRIFAEVFILRDDFVLSVRPWIRLGQSRDNPDIDNYLGRYEVRGSYERNHHVYSVLLRNIFRAGNRYNAELDWSFPIAGRLRGFVQWYDGYGESLIDYNLKTRRLGIGLLISDWL